MLNIAGLGFLDLRLQNKASFKVRLSFFYLVCQCVRAFVCACACTCVYMHPLAHPCHVMNLEVRE